MHVSSRKNRKKRVFSPKFLRKSVVKTILEQIIGFEILKLLVKFSLSIAVLPNLSVWRISFLFLCFCNLMFSCTKMYIYARKWISYFLFSTKHILTHTHYNVLLLIRNGRWNYRKQDTRYTFFASWMNSKREV